MPLHSRKPHHPLGKLEMMLSDILEAHPLEPYRLWLRFEDGLEGMVDLSGLRFEGVLAPLKNPAFFAQVRVSPELGTVVWPNGADLDPSVLRAQIKPQALSV